MRRFPNRGQNRSLRASILVEMLEDRQLLASSVLPVSSTFGHYSAPVPINIIAGPSTTLTNGVPTALAPQTGPPTIAPYSPTQIRHAYGVDQLTSLDGTGQTIAIVDAFADPTAASDLAKFDSYYNLPPVNLSVVDAEPSEGPLVTNSDWYLETSLDIEWAHAVAPGAKILLVQAYSDSDTDLFNAVTYAVQLGAKQVSMSWGGGEYAGESSLNSYFTPANAPGVSFFASSGDTGAQVLYPSVSPYVTSVGGTTISLDAQGNRISESAWNAGGGGPSAFLSEPSFQQGFQNTSTRTTPDVAYDADPNSGFLVIDNGSYVQVGGTSCGSPQWAAIMSLANEGLANANKPSVGTGLTYGTNTELYKLAGSTSYTNPNGDFLDITTGSNGHPAGVGYDEATGLGVPLANQLIPDLIGPTVPTGPTIADPNFLAVPVASGGYVYNPTGSPWTFSGSPGSGSGLTSNNSAFTSGNPNAPYGTQDAFLQGQGSITQSVANWTAGTYSISFQAAQRGNYGNSFENFEVLVDGNIVGSFLPSGTSYQTYTTGAFTVTAGAHTIKFLGIDTVNNQDSVFLDAVSVAVATASASPPIADPNFLQLPISAGSYVYNPVGSPWTFSGSPGSGSGLTSNNSAFTSGNPNAPYGTQDAFLQGQGTITQSVPGWLAGNYTISFEAAERGNYGTSLENFEVLVDGNIVGSFLPKTTSYQTYTTNPFSVTAGSHTIKFLGIDTANNQDSVFLDNVATAVATAPPLPSVGDPNFSAVSLPYGSFAYNPTGSPWTFTGQSGISANSSAFTYANPSSPVGNQVAILQDSGSFSQSISGWAAGSYTIAFEADQRYYNGINDQTFAVEVDGVIVSTFQPAGLTYQTYTTTSFTVAAGTHTIAFVGLNANGGENTAFIDAVSIA